MVSKCSLPGPGTVRVGRFIGRLGVVSLPAVEVGLALDQRVVRRHVAKLEAAGWLTRSPWVWGEGSIVWLTAIGMECAGMGGVRPVKAPPAPMTIAHGVLVALTAARLERNARVWKSRRELALDPERWAVPTRCERGYTEQLPDLAVWLNHPEPPVAVIVESGRRREDRQKMILKGWRDAIASGRYAGVHYECASASVAHWIGRLAKKVWLIGPEFSAAVQKSAAEIAVLPAVADDDGEDQIPNERAADTASAVATSEPGHLAEAPAPLTAVPLEAAQPAPQLLAPKTQETAAERERRYREILGMREPKRRRPWRR